MTNPAEPLPPELRNLPEGCSPQEFAILRVRASRLITPGVLAGAWRAWHSRHGGRLGPGVAFSEALRDGIAWALWEGKIVAPGAEARGRQYEGDSVD